MKFNILLLSALAFVLSVSSCGNSAKKDKAADQTEQQGKEYTSAYICPMHCEGSGSDQPGKCPVCGMDYKKNETHNSDAHSHDDHSHDGHSHEGHSH